MRGHLVLFFAVVGAALTAGCSDSTALSRAVERIEALETQITRLEERAEEAADKGALTEAEAQIKRLAAC